MNDDYPTSLDTLKNTATDSADKGGPFIEAVALLETIKGCKDTNFKYVKGTGTVSTTTPACIGE